MTARELIREVERAGGLLRVKNEQLLGSRIPDHLLHLISGLKQEIKLALAQRPVGPEPLRELPRCGACGSACLYRNPDGSTECLTCGPSMAWMDGDVLPTTCPHCRDGWKKLANGGMTKCDHRAANQPRYLTEQQCEEHGDESA
jgi:hypothetical protein